MQTTPAPSTRPATPPRPHLDAQRAALDAAIKRYAARDENARQARRDETAARLLSPRPPARRRPAEDHAVNRDESSVTLPKPKAKGRRLPPTRPDLAK